MPTTENSRRNEQTPLPPSMDKFAERAMPLSDDDAFLADESGQEVNASFNPDAISMPRTMAQSPADEVAGDQLGAGIGAAGDGNRMDIRGSAKEDSRNVSIDDSNEIEYGGPFLDPLRERPRRDGED